MVTELGIQIVKAIQSIQNGFFDMFFSVCSMFGEEVFIILVLVIVYFVIDKRYGEYLGYSLLTSLLLNAGLKNIFKADRPFQADDGIVNKRPETAGGFSFPSGHTQGSTSLFSGLYVFSRKKWLLIVGIVITALVALSRMYLGVHFPKDVLVGWILAVGVSILCFYLFNKFENRHLTYLLTGVIFIPFLFFATTKDLFTNFGLYYGFVLGVIIENKFIKFERADKFWKKLLRIVISLVIVIGVKEGFKLFLPDANWAHAVRYFFVAVGGIGLSSAIIKVAKI